MERDIVEGASTPRASKLNAMLEPLAITVLIASMGPTAFVVLHVASILRVHVDAYADKLQILTRF